jgi:hypothetical protein
MYHSSSSSYVWQGWPGNTSGGKPDIILGTETWLDKDTSSYEFFPSELFNVYRSDRKPNKNNQSYGGVLITINKEFITSGGNSQW